MARSLVLVRHSALPEEASRAIARLLPLGRRVLAATYLRSYRARRPVDPERLQSWWRVCVTARLAEDIEGERDELLTVARQAAARSAAMTAASDR